MLSNRETAGGWHLIPTRSALLDGPALSGAPIDRDHGEFAGAFDWQAA